MKKKIKGFFTSIVNLFRNIFKSPKLTVVFILCVFVGVILVSGAVNSRKQTDERQKAIDAARQREAEEAASEPDLSNFNGSDVRLMESQDDLVATYGAVPEGYIWDFDGTLLSLGDKSLSAEDVLYAYFNGVRSLDFSMVQKYSRNSTVFDTYNEYFSSDNKNVDYYDSFLRNMYKEVLLSIQVDKVVDVSVFANNKQVYTVEITMLDLSNKDFWRKDEDEIYNNLYVYSLDESDSAKSESYLYDYVLNYYKNNKALVQTKTVNIVVEKYKDLDTGWLVSDDSELDSICKYKEGNLTVSYIQSQFNDYGKEKIKQERDDATSEATTEEGNTAEGSTTEGSSNGTNVTIKNSQ